MNKQPDRRSDRRQGTSMCRCGRELTAGANGQAYSTAMGHGNDGPRLWCRHCETLDRRGAKGERRQALRRQLADVGAAVDYMGAELEELTKARHDDRAELEALLHRFAVLAPALEELTARVAELEAEPPEAEPDASTVTMLNGGEERALRRVHAGLEAEWHRDAALVGVLATLRELKLVTWNPGDPQAEQPGSYTVSPRGREALERMGAW